MSVPLLSCLLYVFQSYSPAMCNKRGSRTYFFDDPRGMGDDTVLSGVTVSILIAGIRIFDSSDI